MITDAECSAAAARLAAALNALNAAKLDASIYRTARRLLDHTGSNGLSAFTRQQMLALCGTQSENSVRRHLNDLHAAGLIEYSYGERVYVAFVALLPNESLPDPQRQRRAAPASIVCKPQPGQGHHTVNLGVRAARGGNHTARENNQPARGDDHIARDAARSSHTRAGWVGGFDPDPSPSGELSPTTHPTTQTPTHAGAGAEATLPADAGLEEQDAAQPESDAPGRSEQERNYALLTDPAVGVTSWRAGLLASRHSFPALLAQVCNFRRDLEHGTVHSVGALVRRIENGFGATITDEDRDTPLWRRHVTLEDEAAWNAADEAEQRHRKYDLSPFV